MGVNLFSGMEIWSRNRSDNESGVEFQHFCFEAFKYIIFTTSWAFLSKLDTGTWIEIVFFFRWTKVADFEEKVARRSKHKLNVLTFFASLLVIVSDRQTLQNSKTYKTFFKDVQKNGEIKCASEI